jgi:hypothetical protein
MDSCSSIPLFSMQTPPHPDKFRLLAVTQVYENYNWDDPEGAPYWKAKGGNDFLVAELTLEQAQRGRAYLENAVECARPYIEANGPMYREHLIGWELLAPGELTEFERQQLEWDGQVAYHPTSVAELQRRARVEQGAATVYLPQITAESRPMAQEESA